MNRDAFLSRVRDAARAGTAHRSDVRNDLPARTGYMGAGDDLLQRFVDEVNLVGGEARVADNLAAAGELLQALLAKYSVRVAACWRHRLLDQLGLGELLASAQVEQVDYDSLSIRPHDVQRAKLLAADIGISSCNYAVAELGTLAAFSNPGQERLITLLPPVHVALVAESQLVPDLFDLFEILSDRQPADLPSNATLITGPSKTGDIELQLTTGVHGPGKIHVVAIRNI